MTTDNMNIQISATSPDEDLRECEIIRDRKKSIGRVAGLWIGDAVREGESQPTAYSHKGEHSPDGDHHLACFSLTACEPRKALNAT